MKHATSLFGFLVAVSLVSTASAQAIYPDFALVVRLPSYEAFLRNLGTSPIRVDGYQVSSVSASLDPVDWVRLGAGGAAIVAALGPGADGFFAANPTPSSLAELNPLGSGTWQPGQSWSIGFPFKSDSPSFVLDAVFRFTSPDGLVLTGGTVVAPGDFAPAEFFVVPEPASGALLALAATGVVALNGRLGRRSADDPSN